MVLHGIGAGLAAKLLTKGAVGAEVGQQIQKITSKKSIEWFGYDFPKLLFMLVIFYSVAWLVSKYFEAVLTGTGFLNSIIKIISPIYKVPTLEENEIIKQLFITGFGEQKVKYWDIIKGASIVLTIYEMMQFKEYSENIGSKPSMITYSIFGMIILFLSLITIPEIIQRLKDLNKV